MTVDIPPTRMEEPARLAVIEVVSIRRHVPELIRIRAVEVEPAEDEDRARAPREDAP